jgi:predicted dehydrogenase
MEQRDVSRRTFLTLPAAAVVTNARAQSPNETVRVAFIGVGNRGRYLLTNMKTVPGMQIAAICDINPGALAQSAADTPGADTVSDYRRLLDRKDIDAVVIATPVDTHKEISVAALDSARNVYSEKPMALTPEECRAIVTAARSAKGIYQAGFQLRYDPNRHASIDFIHQGGLGRVVFCQGFRHTGDLPRATSWYFDAKRSGDSIVEQACHILDLFTWAIGAHPLRALGSGGITLYKNLPPGRTTMDNYSVIYEYPNDVRVCFSHIYFDPDGFSGIKERVFGANGAIDLGTATWRELGKRSEPIQLHAPDAGKDSTYLSLAAFIDNVRSHKQPLNDVESARRSTLVAMMGRKAIYEKRTVTWEEVDIL